MPFLSATHDTNDRSWGIRQRTIESECRRIEAERLQREQFHIDQFGTTCSYYARNRNPLTFEYYIRRTN